MLRFSFLHLRLAIIAIDKANLLIIVHPIRKIINWCYQRSTCKTEATRSPPACEARNIGSVPSLIARRRSSHTLHDDKYIFRFLEIHLPVNRNTGSNMNNIRHTSSVPTLIARCLSCHTLRSEKYTFQCREIQI